MNRELDFERPVLEIERQIDELRRLAAGPEQLSNVVAIDSAERPAPDADAKKLYQQVRQLEQRAQKLTEQIFSRLTRWQTVQLARHPARPYTLDYVQGLFTDFVELHGDRRFGEDAAIVGGLARFHGQTVLVVGHQKGRTTAENMTRNFGMPRPEGYRKAVRLFRLAEQFRVPILTFIDTPGAYPGLGAEERGQAQAIAEALEVMADLSVPVIATVIGEGGSGGALAIGVANRVLMLEFSIYSVISPEGCASILFKDATYAERAADALRLTAKDLQKLGVIDEIVPEPLGGAHRQPQQTQSRLAEHLQRHLREMRNWSAEALRDDRYRRFRRLGEVDGQVEVLEALMANAPGPDDAKAPEGGVKEPGPDTVDLESENAAPQA
jgi:acetyl-CoA carboxylase carboxyl transferase subunit alpha